MRSAQEITRNNIARFADWNKSVSMDSRNGFYGNYGNNIAYINTSIGHMITLHFKFGQPCLSFIIESLTSSELEILRNKFTNPFPERSLQLGFHREASSPDTILSNVKFTTETASYPGQLDHTLKMLAEYAKLPEDLLLDILEAINTHADQQKNRMEKLTRDLLNGTPAIIKDLQKNIIIYNIHEEFGVVLRWIDYLVTNDRLQDAILWCGVVSKQTDEYYIAHQKLAMQLIKELQIRMTTQLAVYQNGIQVKLSCEEAAFHFACNIAKYTKEDADVASMKKILDELSGMAHSSPCMMSERYLLILQARTIKTLQNDILQLKKNTPVQQSISSSLLGSLGLFGQPDNLQKNDSQKNETDTLDFEFLATMASLMDM